MRYQYLWLIGAILLFLLFAEIYERQTRGQFSWPLLTTTPTQLTYYNRITIPFPIMAEPNDTATYTK